MIKLDRRSFVKELSATTALGLSGCRLFSSSEKVVSFGIVTDLHYAKIPMSKWGDGQYHEDSLARLTSAIDVFNTRSLDFMVELGDFKDLQTNEAGKPDHDLTVEKAKEIEQAFSRFSGPRYHVLGNHDHDILEKAELAQLWKNSVSSDNRWYYSFVVAGTRFIVLDANYTPEGKPFSPSTEWKWQECLIPNEEIDWLRNELAQSNERVVIFNHERLDGDLSMPHVVRNASDVRKILEDSKKVIAVFQGHEHSGNYSVTNGIPYYTLRAMVSGPNANSFAEVRLHPSGRVQIIGYGKARSVDFAAPQGQTTVSFGEQDTFMSRSVELPLIYSSQLTK